MPDKIPTFELPGTSAGAARRAYEADVDRADDKRFYASTAWRRVRALILAREPRCVRCLAAGRVALARQVHHRTPRKSDPARALDPRNLEGLCDACHPDAEREAAAIADGKPRLPTLDDLMLARR
jgi:5-methylcytosine-specific restriction endonuclease McrA